MHLVEDSVLNRFCLLLSEGKKFALQICENEVVLGNARRKYCVNAIKKNSGP